jgi:Family of unknown function (DUF6364)
VLSGLTLSRIFYSSPFLGVLHASSILFMTTKLTLNLDSKVIGEAKRFAKKRGTSLSRLVEDHLRKTVTIKKPEKKRSIKELSGILGPVPANFNYKEAVADYLIEKHLKR